MNMFKWAVAAAVALQLALFAVGARAAEEPGAEGQPRTRFNPRAELTPYI